MAADIWLFLLIVFQVVIVDVFPLPCQVLGAEVGSGGGWLMTAPALRIWCYHIVHVKYTTVFSVVLLSQTAFPCSSSGFECQSFHNGTHPSSTLSEVAVWNSFIDAEEKQEMELSGVQLISF